MGSVNRADLDWTVIEHGETKFKRKQLANAADADQIGCSLYELPPEHKSWPYHYHTANEEALYVLDGTGILRLGNEMISVTEGDYMSFPANENGAHGVINDSSIPLRYLMISTMNEPDVTLYPDSDKFGVFVDSPPGGREERSLEGYYRLDENVDYWEGE